VGVDQGGVLGRLRRLDVSYNKLTATGAAAVMRAAVGAGVALEALDLSHTGIDT
jgi:hypothetical protein